MKTAIKTQLLISALVLCALLLVSCTKEGEDMQSDKSNQRDMDAPGSILDRSNPTAPKKTASKEIDSFEYAFNCAFLTRPVRYEHCTFKLARSEEGAMCTAWSYGDLDAMFEFEFTVPASTLDALQAIIEEHALASANGVDKTIQGIPERLGATLLVEYTSGERIYAHDNSSSVLSAKATDALFGFFRALAKEADCDFLHTHGEIMDFQEFLGGCWQDPDKTAMLDFWGDSVKIYVDGQLTDDTTFSIEYDRLFGAQSEDGSFSLYAYIERRDGALYCLDKKGIETKFYGCPDAEAPEQAGTQAVEEDDVMKTTFVFDKLPQSLTELEALPEAALTTPYQVAALTVAALCRYGEDPQAAIAMLNYLKGPQPLSTYEMQFLKDRLSGKAYKPFSFFEGATPGNNYTPAQPFQITVFDGPYSFQEAGYAKLMIRSGGADNPREIKLRQKGTGGQWFLWENFLLSDIRQPKEADPWG